MMKHSKIGVIVSARMASSRLPGKAMLPLLGLPMLKFLFTRLKTTKSNVQIVLATTQQPEDDILCRVADDMECESFRGNTQDLISRYLDCAMHFKMDYVVRVTADCPFVDGQSLDYFLENAFEEPQNFSLATTKQQFPVGIDFELFNTKTLQAIYNNENISADDREHLTLYFYKNPNNFNIKKIMPPTQWKKCTSSFTVDTPEDYNRAITLANYFNNPNFEIRDLINNEILCNSNILNPA